MIVAIRGHMWPTVSETHLEQYVLYIYFMAVHFIITLLTLKMATSVVEAA